MGGDLRARLEHWHRLVAQVFLSRQRPGARLLPASTAHTVHGDYGHAWVRDNVNTILAAWGLARAWRRQAPDCSQTAELEASVVDLMRGLLAAMMGQADKVERFKRTEDPLESLHAKYDADTGKPVVSDEGWGHLQIDATSIFLLQLAQMSAGGLSIIRTRREAAFVQNLIHYIGPAYRLPDYGVWERGHKGNIGAREVNASSVGMAKAALEAMQRFAFALEDGSRAVMRVPPDEIARARETLLALLPAESASKETDAALLSVIGYPCFAVESAALCDATRDKVLSLLKGRYGCKRFLRDGHQTAVEDHSRLHYETGELGIFENIESEWPLFFTYLAVDAAVTGDTPRRDALLDTLATLAVDREGVALLPELYLVPDDLVPAEMAAPGSQTRVPNENVPLFWAQSLWMLTQMMAEGVVTADDVDPMGRRFRRGAPVGAKVDVFAVADAPGAFADAPFAEKIAHKSDLADDLSILPAGALAQLLAHVGEEASLGLSGRPPRRLGALITSQLFEQGGRTFVFTPSSLDSTRSYLRFDGAAYADRLRADIAYVARHWIGEEAPVIVAPVTAEALAGAGGAALQALLSECAQGKIGGADVNLVDAQSLEGRRKVSVDDLAALPMSLEPARLQSRVNPIWRHEAAADLPELTEADTPTLLARLGATDSLDEMIEALCILMARGAAMEEAPGRGRVREIAIGLYHAAGRREDWRTVRRMAMAIDLVDERLADMVKELVVRLKRIELAGAGDPAMTVARPLKGEDIRPMMRKAAGEDVLRCVLGEELLLHIGAEIKADPSRFVGCRTIRLWDWLHVLGAPDPFAPEERREVAEAAPSKVAAWVRDFVQATPGVRDVLQHDAAVEDDGPAHWRRWRVRLGVMTRVGGDFFDRLWNLLGRCDGLVVGHVEAAAARLDARILRSDHTPRERQFALLVEDRLSRIDAPIYRTLTLEAMNAAALECEADPAFHISGDLLLDELIHGVVADVAGHACDPWAEFCLRPPAEVCALFRAALRRRVSGDNRIAAQ
jgi:phosphorylase kinase alpha/beta subunit